MERLIATMRQRILWILTLQLVVATLSARGLAIDIFTRGSEIALGQRVAKEIESQIPLWEEQAQLSRVRRIGMSILSVCDRKDMPYEFKILNIDEPNALALPGGFIYLTRGLLETVTSDDELAFVIAHEVGHVVGRHARKAISQDAIISVLASILLGGASQIIRTAADVLYTMQRLGYSRNQEREADNLALKYMKAAGYNPLGAISMLSKFAERKLRGLERYFSTHPGADERMERLLKQLGINMSTASLKERLPAMLSSSNDPFLPQPICYLSGASIFIAHDGGKAELWTAKGEDGQSKSDIAWYQVAAQSRRIFILTTHQGGTQSHLVMLTLQADLSAQTQHLMKLSSPQTEGRLISLSPDGKMLAATSFENGSWRLALLDIEHMRTSTLPLGDGRTPCNSMVWQAPHSRLFIPVVNEQGQHELLSCTVNDGKLKEVRGWQKLLSDFSNVSLQAYWADASLLIIHATDKTGVEKLLCLNEHTGALHELSSGILEFVIGHSCGKFALTRINNSRHELWVGEMPQLKPKVDAVKLLRTSISEAMPIETREGVSSCSTFSNDGTMLAYAFKPYLSDHWEVWVVNLTRRQAQRIATDAVEPQFITLNHVAASWTVRQSQFAFAISAALGEQRGHAFQPLGAMP
ncbi:MAG: M48 family metallopeptidase [Armatimonadota bacterium]|nr:M48 family metallopeptidase [Armatimonadota bacterium]MCX7776745.1 M48 family metallopeptidase [Armatimonadota bacterium]MDW8024543.1 M48 family metallopeptidase [Armatimonadota bacterium]